MTARRGGRDIPTIVTFLDMKAHPTLPPPPVPSGKIAILRAENPPTHFYRYLYDTIGAAYFWVDRRKINDEALGLLLTDPAVHLNVLYVDGCPAGMAELDFRKSPTGQLAYFGLLPEFVGRRLGHYFLHHTVLNAWTQPIERLRVNTCTLDHPRALPLYQRVGFTPYAREERIIRVP
jgi:GNAT superfamily N-acetyltransferase